MAQNGEGSSTFATERGSRVLDIAAGSNWQFPLEYKSAFGLHLTGLDVHSDAVQSNPFLDEALVWDVCREPLPRADYFDLIPVTPASSTSPT